MTAQPEIGEIIYQLGNKTENTQKNQWGCTFSCTDSSQQIGDSELNNRQKITRSKIFNFII